MDALVLWFAGRVGGFGSRMDDWTRSTSGLRDGLVCFTVSACDSRVVGWYRSTSGLPDGLTLPLAGWVSA